MSIKLICLNLPLPPNLRKRQSRLLWIRNSRIFVSNDITASFPKRKSYLFPLLFMLSFHFSVEMGRSIFKMGSQRLWWSTYYTSLFKENMDTGFSGICMKIGYPIPDRVVRDVAVL